jgi:hypothetical protein
MKTKDFIKMLQEADPEGEGYVRLPGGGAPWLAETKEGYWDGPYQYLEYQKNEHGHDAILVTSKIGYKVDIHVMDTESIIWELHGNMEDIKKRIRFDFAVMADPEQRKEKEAERWKHIEKEAAYARGCHEKSLKEWTERVIERYVDNGYEIRQPLDKPIGYYHCMTAHSFFKKENFCQGECMAIIMSGKFYPEKKDEKYYVWKYDPEKGKDWSIK